ncbi:hypothetical protein F4860DRAFT_480503 [Xylaria cubensis]|nr:hypothetical protein F4860DRAFT_480503 [Xylaria cubensis]
MQIQIYLSILFALAGIVSSAPVDNADAGKTLGTHFRPIWVIGLDGEDKAQHIDVRPWKDGTENQASRSKSHNHARADDAAPPPPPPTFLSYWG